MVQRFTSNYQCLLITQVIYQYANHQSKILLTSQQILFFSKGKQQDTMTTALTKKGMNQSTSSNWVNGQKIYTKAGLTPQGVKNYQLLMNIGVGVRLMSADANKGIVEMESGHTIHAIVKNKIVGKEGLNLIWKELMNIRQTMINNKLAHTDIKPLNVAVKFLSQDLKTFRAFLIDNEDMRKYGEDRLVGTPGANTNGNPQICSATTDDMGWNYIKNFMGV